MLEPTEYELEQLLHAAVNFAPRQPIVANARDTQRNALAQSVKTLEGLLEKLDSLIVKREQAEASENRKGKAKQERSAKEANKPNSVVKKAENARESTKNSESKPKSSSELKSLATKVRGQIAVAKQKLAAL